MAIAFVQKVSSQVAGVADNTTSALSVTAGNAIIIAIGSYFGFTSAKDSYDSDTSKYASDVNSDTAGGGPKARLVSRLNLPSTGSYTFTVTCTGSGTGYSSITVREFSGLATSAAADKTATGSTTAGTSHSAGATAALSQNDELAVGVGTDALASTNSVTGWTDAVFLARGGGGYEQAVSAYNIVADGSAQTFSWTSSSAVDSKSVICTYRQAGAATASLPPIGQPLSPYLAR